MRDNLINLEFNWYIGDTVALLYAASPVMQVVAVDPVDLTVQLVWFDGSRVCTAVLPVDALRQLERATSRTVPPGVVVNFPQKAPGPCVPSVQEST